ncbi:MAG: phosphoribosylglycinamide formyltransferase [Planctomycetota bacterium]|nr:phosphoribosylglycinamide formyltransferase [Planctomycetota bacterium]
MAKKPPARIGILLSGTGSTFKNLLDHIESGDLAAEIVIVLSDREGAKGLDYARDRGIPVAVVSRKAYRGLERYSHAMEEALRPYAPDWVLNCGFLTIYQVPSDLVGRVLNVHPSLLPAFGGKGCYGHRVHEMVIDKQVRYSGCTVHFATDDVDEGPIIDQMVVEVLEGDTPDTLAERVQAAERELYPRVVKDVIQGKVRMEGGRTVRS